jgi:predicted deacetylase
MEELSNRESKAYLDWMEQLRKENEQVRLSAYNTTAKKADAMFDKAKEANERHELAKKLFR